MTRSYLRDQISESRLVAATRLSGGALPAERAERADRSARSARSARLTLAGGRFSQVDASLERLSGVHEPDYEAFHARPLAMLRGLVAYSPRSTVRLRLRLAGATVLDSLDDARQDAASVTHAVLPRSSVHDGSCAEARTKLRLAKVAVAPAGPTSAPLPGGSESRARPACHTQHWRRAALVLDEGWLAACEERRARVDERGFLLHEGSTGLNDLSEP
jgi:hypothetical protein